MDPVKILGEKVVWANGAPQSLVEKHGNGPFEVVGADYSTSMDQPPLSILVGERGYRIKVQWYWVTEA